MPQILTWQHPQGYNSTVTQEVAPSGPGFTGHFLIFGFGCVGRLVPRRKVFDLLNGGRSQRKLKLVPGLSPHPRDKRGCMEYLYADLTFAIPILIRSFYSKLGKSNYLWSLKGQNPVPSEFTWCWLGPMAPLRACCHHALSNVRFSVIQKPVIK